MYPDCGKSIKKLVSIVVKIGYAVSILWAVIILIAGIAADNVGVFVLTLFLAGVVGALGCFASWCSGLWLYAYGEITDRIINIDEKMTAENLPEEKKPLFATPVSQRGCYCETCGAKNAAGARYCVACSAELDGVKVPAGGWKCTCGRVNASYVSTCACGVNRREIQK
ncbi:MAG: hypothetical protein E7455_08170 [Ruminococcaceae bacterium]|nr:hypothetical protein [Oscillospiraceae bacterium]